MHCGSTSHAGPDPLVRITVVGEIVTQPEILIAIGRTVFGLFFVIAGYRNFRDIQGRIGSPTNYGWALPTPFLVIGYAIQLIGGLALVFNFWTVYAAIAIIIFLVIATELYHNLFMFQGNDRKPHLYFTLVNITLVAGLLQVIANA